jgi:hypothetical protein
VLDTVKRGFIWSQKNKERLFWVFLLVVTLINLQYFSFDNYFIRLAIRIPQVVLIFMIYRRFVNNNLLEINLKYRLKGFWHHLVLVVGIVEFLVLVTANKIIAGKSNAYPDSLSVVMNAFHNHFITTILTLFVALILFVPLIYFLLFGTSKLRDITIWFYMNKIKYFFVFLIFEDVATTCFLSLLK